MTSRQWQRTMTAPSRRPTEQSAHAHLPGREQVVFFHPGQPLRRVERVEIDTGEVACTAGRVAMLVPRRALLSLDLL